MTPHSPARAATADTPADDARPRTVVLLGFGAVGRAVAAGLAPERDAGRVRLTAAVRDVAAHRARGDLGVRLAPLGDPEGPAAGLPAADLVVECAGIVPARRLGPAVVGRGTDLVLSSVGALARPEAAEALLAGPGRLHVTNGAIGGFDVLEAAAEADGLDEVRIRSVKHPRGLVRPWMSPAEAARLEGLRPQDGPVVVLEGDPAEAVERFPANVNVAVALAWATRGRPTGPGDHDAARLERSLRRVRVELVADAAAERTRHDVLASGPAGRLELTFASAPSSDNPRTSQLTALSVTRTVRRVLGLTPGG